MLVLYGAMQWQYGIKIKPGLEDLALLLVLVFLLKELVGLLQLLFLPPATPTASQTDRETERQTERQ